MSSYRLPPPPMRKHRHGQREPPTLCLDKAVQAQQSSGYGNRGTTGAERPNEKWACLVNAWGTRYGKRMTMWHYHIVT